jgi:hypothetical protein
MVGHIKTTAGLGMGQLGICLEHQPIRDVKHHWNKSQIWCQLTQVSTCDSLHNWHYVIVNRKSVSARPHSINVEHIFIEYKFEGTQNY